MFFTVKCKSNSLLAIYNAKTIARKYIILSGIGATEAQLNEYIYKNYKLSLKAACLKLIAKAKYSLNYQNEIIVSFTDKKLDELASIITYGTGKIPGSLVLRCAFGQTRKE